MSAAGCPLFLISLRLLSLRLFTLECSIVTSLPSSAANKNPIPTDKPIHLIENRAPVLSPTYTRADPLPQRGNFRVPFCPTYRLIFRRKWRQFASIEL